MKNIKTHGLYLITKSRTPKNHHFTELEKETGGYLGSLGLKTMVGDYLESSDLVESKEQLQVIDYQKKKNSQEKKSNFIGTKKVPVCGVSESNELELPSTDLKEIKSIGTKIEKIKDIIDSLSFSLKNVFKFTSILRHELLEVTSVKFASSRECFSHLSIKNKGAQ